MPMLPSELEKKVEALQSEVRGLKKENEKLLMMGHIGKEKMEEAEGSAVLNSFTREGMPSSVRGKGRPSPSHVRGRNTYTPGQNANDAGMDDDFSNDGSSLADSSAEAKNLYQEFREGGVGRITSEVRSMVSQSGKLLGKIQELEKIENENKDESVATSAFMSLSSPYLFE